jgi:nucleoside-diphosphate-sugar epimerase
MRVFVAGAGGALGTHLVRHLVADGHEVIGLTLSTAHAELVHQLGASRSIAGDALNPSSIRAALESTHPEAVVHALTAIPKRGPWRASDLEQTNELRIRGTKHLLDAAIAVGARRLVVESMVFIYGCGDLGADWLTEETRVGERVPKVWLRPSVDALVSMETQVLEVTRMGSIEGIVLRFGGFYGPNAGTEIIARLLRHRWLPVLKNSDDFVIPLIHIDDAAAAVVAALHAGKPGEVYNIVDDEPASFSRIVRDLASSIGVPQPRAVPKWFVRLVAPYAAAAWLGTKMQVSNTKAKRELQWKPHFPNYRSGIAEFSHKAKEL